MLNFNWLRGTVASDRAQLGVLSGHRYPLGACAAPGTTGFPTVEKLLAVPHPGPAMLLVLARIADDPPRFAPQPTGWD